MNNNMKQFIESVKVTNTEKVVEYVFKKIDDDIEHCSLIELEQIILKTRPKSPKDIITICYILGQYAKWLKEQNIVDDDSMYQMIQSLDKKMLWEKAKINADKKFISYEEFKDVLRMINMKEELNVLYYQLLFRSIYEGIYNDDMSVLKNLRSSDIGDDIVVLHEDNGHNYKLKISSSLASDLKDFTKVDVWERNNRYGVCRIETRGVYYDSIFKIENRNKGSNPDGTYKFSYYKKLKKISREYIERTLTPSQLYVSGIMSRIKTELNNNNISLEDAFSEGNRDRISNSIISNELIRCNYNIEVGQFKELVKGHIDSF